MATKKKVSYTEPADYIPKDIRKKMGLGEYAKAGKSTAKKTSKKK